MSPGSEAAREWREKMARYREEKMERRKEIENLKHRATLARLEADCAKYERIVDELGGDDDGDYDDDDGTPVDPFADFASNALRAIMRGQNVGQTSAGSAAGTERIEDAVGQDRKSVTDAIEAEIVEKDA